ncbi:MAG: hypothetical protein AAF602_11500 [Myxococcota bacterium]
MVARVFLVLGLSCLVGCEEPPIYSNIRSVTVHQQTGASGTQKTELTGEKLERAVQCLARTVETTEEESKKADFIQDIVVIQVVDRIGDRMFELFTKEHLKGNKGKYYQNRCIYGIIRK